MVFDFQAIASFTVLLLVLFCGYLIPKSSIKPWWVWCYWLTPLSWTYVALSLNEFSAPTYNVPFSQSLPMLGTKGSAYLKIYGLPTEQSRQWVLSHTKREILINLPKLNKTTMKKKEHFSLSFFFCSVIFFVF